VMFAASSPFVLVAATHLGPSIGNTGGGFIVWLSNLQPVIYPLGHTLAEGLNIFPVPSEGDI